MRDRGQRFMVWRVADLIGMHPERQQDWLALHERITKTPPTGTTPRRKIQYLGPTGYVLWSTEQLEALDMGACADLQDLVFHYEGVRQHKGEPCRSEPCTACKPPHSKHCHQCAGTGRIWVLLEMSDEEIHLAQTGEVTA